MNKFVFIFFFFSAILSAHEWTGSEYHKNSFEQRGAGQRLMGGFSLKGDEAILDLGCGDGFLTSLLAEKVPQGSVTGIDLSPSMVDFASRNFASNHLAFRVLDATKLDYEDRFDLVTSFTALHWIPDQLSVLLGIYRSLKPGGKMIVEMPNRLPLPLEKSVERVVDQDEWRDYFIDFDYWVDHKYFQVSEYEDLVAESGLKLVRIDQFTETNAFPSRKAFAGFLKQWFPYLRVLPENKKEVFLNEVLEGYFEYLPPDEEGHPLFLVSRLRVQAVRDNL